MSITVTTGSVLTGGGSVALGSSVNPDVAVDGGTIEVSADAHRVKDSGMSVKDQDDDRDEDRDQHPDRKWRHSGTRTKRRRRRRRC
jgi:hypothetical protein